MMNPNKYPGRRILRRDNYLKVWDYLGRLDVWPLFVAHVHPAEGFIPVLAKMKSDQRPNTFSTQHRVLHSLCSPSA